MRERVRPASIPLLHVSTSSLRTHAGVRCLTMFPGALGAPRRGPGHGRRGEQITFPAVGGVRLRVVGRTAAVAASLGWEVVVAGVLEEEAVMAGVLEGEVVMAP